MKYIWKPAKAFTKGRVGSLQSIILHSTDGREAGDVATLTGDKVSVHWYVTKTGKVYHFVDDTDTAWHAGAVCSERYANSASIGIEQEHIDGLDSWPDVQVNAVALLVKCLQAKHGPLQVTSHAKVAVPPGRKVDPMNYPWEKFNKAVALAVAEPLEPVK